MQGSERTILEEVSERIVVLPVLPLTAGVENMPRKKLIVVAIVMAAVLMVPYGTTQSGHAPSGKKPSFSLALSFKAPEYRIGSEMWIVITQTNLTRHHVDCTVVWSGIDTTYQYEATYENGQPAERMLRSNAMNDVHPCTLRRGEAAKRDILINRVFKLDKPGRYVLRVARPDPAYDHGGDQTLVWSNPVTITIIG